MLLGKQLQEGRYYEDDRGRDALTGDDLFEGSASVQPVEAMGRPEDWGMPVMEA